MTTLMNPRRLALTAAVLAGTFVGSWATPSPGASTAHEILATRQCGSMFCTNLIWLRAPILRVRTR
jgi:hypothetical protein